MAVLALATRSLTDTVVHVAAVGTFWLTYNATAGMVMPVTLPLLSVTTPLAGTTTLSPVQPAMWLTTTSADVPR